MNTEMLVMAVTRLSDGACVACLDANNRWVRPTQEGRNGWRQLTTRHLRDRTGQVVVQTGNLIQWDLGRPIPRDVHTEDVLVGYAPPRLLRVLPPEEFRCRYEVVCDPSPASFLRSTDRSLALVKPERVDQIRFSTEGKGGIKARIHIASKGFQEHLSVKDLSWRALGRQTLGRLGEAPVSWTSESLFQQTQLRIEALVIGRGQAFEDKSHPLAGAYWPFVIGVLTKPPNRTPIDYGNL